MKIDIWKVPFTSVDTPSLFSYELMYKGYIEMDEFDVDECWHLCNWSCWGNRKKPSQLYADVDVANSDIIFHDPEFDQYYLALRQGWLIEDSLDDIMRYIQHSRQQRFYADTKSDRMIFESKKDQIAALKVLGSCLSMHKEDVIRLDEVQNQLEIDVFRSSIHITATFPTECSCLEIKIYLKNRLLENHFLDELFSRIKNFEADTAVWMYFDDDPFSHSPLLTKVCVFGPHAKEHVQQISA